jgi:hypothetical protein
MKRILLIVMLTIYSQLLFAQIKVPDVGPGWKEKVDSAIVVIRTYDCDKYELAVEHCKEIEYWTGAFATTDVTSILIPKTELNAGVINNIAAIIVHESLHLYFLHTRARYTVSVEERLCYLYELEFLKKIPNVEPWLIKNAEKQIKIYANAKDFK